LLTARAHALGRLALRLGERKPQGLPKLSFSPGRRNGRSAVCNAAPLWPAPGAGRTDEKGRLDGKSARPYPGGGAAWLSGPIPEWRGAKGRQENGKPAANLVDLAAPAFRKHKKKGFLGEIVIFSNAG